MATTIHRNSLKPGYTLHWYEIKDILGQGGFGITYLAQDNNLHTQVAIKEYLPIEMAVREGDFSVHPVTENHSDQYQWGLDRFLSEARTLAQFNHPNIVRVHAVFEANNTGYMVMSYEEGLSLADKLKGRKTLEESELLKILLPLMGGIELMHNAGFIHRDIKPDNIFIRNDGSPVLLDFGSARQALGGKTHTLTSLVTPGYAPFEQYYAKSDEQGPWSDIYGLGATLYRAISGVAPMDAVDRSNSLLKRSHDSYVDCREICEGKYTDRFLNAINHALKFNIEDRPQSIALWRQDFDIPTAPLESSKTEYIPTQPRTEIHVPAERRSGLHKLILVAVLIGVVLVAGYMFYGKKETATEAVMDTAESSADVQQPVEAIESQEKESLTKSEEPPVEDVVVATEPENFDGSNVEDLQKKADAGDVYAQVYLGDMYYYGNGIAQDFNKARELYEKASAKGDPDAQTNLGYMYDSGQGGIQDYVKARELYESASAQGNSYAQTNLGLMYEDGRGGLEKSDQKAVELYQIAASLGNPIAQTNLGLMYEQARGGLQKNEIKAAELYQIAASQGNSYAQTNLGLMYESGRGGLEKNDLKAVELYQMAVAQGNAVAQTNLGLMYEDGRGGLEKSDQKAIELYETAATQNNSNALNNLGVMHEEGRGGFKKDILKAVEYYKKSAALGNQTAIGNLKRLGIQF